MGTVLRCFIYIPVPNIMKGSNNNSQARKYAFLLHRSAIRISEKKPRNI